MNFINSYAKINLSINILSKRSDNYHNVEMIMQTISLYDKIFMKKIKEDKIIIESNVKSLENEDNLIHKLLNNIKSIYKITDGIYVYLYKNIPMGAGLAGGSSNAAKSLILADKVFNLNLNDSDFFEHSKNLGADIAFFFKEGTALASGIGNKLEYLEKSPKFFVLLVYPNINISTKEIYSSIEVNKINDFANTNNLINFINNENLDLLTKNIVNNFEPTVFEKYPLINKLIQDLKETNALNANISGTGSTCFAIYSDFGKANKALQYMKSKNNNYKYFIAKSMGHIL